MTEAQRHTIKKLELNITLPADTPQDKAVDVSKEMYSNYFADAIEMALGSFSEHESIIIKDINIDLGEIAPEDIPPALESKLKEKIMECTNASKSIFQISTSFISLEDAIVQAFMEYIETGYTELHIAGKTYELKELINEGVSQIISNAEMRMKLHDFFTSNVSPVFRFNDLADDNVLIYMIAQLLEISHISTIETSPLKTWPHKALSMALIASIYAPNELYKVLTHDFTEEIINQFSTAYQNLKHDFMSYHNSAKIKKQVESLLNKIVNQISSNDFVSNHFPKQEHRGSQNKATEAKKDLYLDNQESQRRESSERLDSEKLAYFSVANSKASQEKSDNLEDIYLENTTNSQKESAQPIREIRNDYNSNHETFEQEVVGKNVGQSTKEDLFIENKANIQTQNHTQAQANRVATEQIKARETSQINAHVETRNDVMQIDSNAGETNDKMAATLAKEDLYVENKADIQTQNHTQTKANRVATEQNKACETSHPDAHEEALSMSLQSSTSENPSDNALQTNQKDIDTGIARSTDITFDDVTTEERKTAQQHPSQEQGKTIEYKHEAPATATPTPTDREQTAHSEAGILNTAQIPEEESYDSIIEYADNAGEYADIVEEGIDPYEWMRTDKRIHTSDAGLVLLNPFITVFFARLGLTNEDNSFETMEQRMRAAHLLRVLAFGPEEEHDDCKLVFCKILCGISPEVPCFIDFIPTEQECAEMDSLIASVCEYWSIMRGTSTNGFRQTFLQRHGTIEKDDAGWLVRVEGKTLDILMEDLPWGITTFVLPWTRPFFVDWQKSI